MQAGSLLECIETPPETLLFYLSGGGEKPAKGVIYTCCDLYRCPCGTHDLVELEELPGHGWHADYFREVQPPIAIDDIFTEPETVPIVRELEPELV
jgi:hypothetical protein